jgi:hypothetical protein
MDKLQYIIPAAIAGAGIMVGLAYVGGAFSVSDFNYPAAEKDINTSFGTPKKPEVSDYQQAGKRRKHKGNKKTKRRNK